MFGSQRMRLQRFFDSGTVQDLAEELYAMSGAEVANATSAPVVVTLPDGSTVAPYQIGNYDEGSPVFTIIKGNGDVMGTIGIQDKGWTFTTPTGTTTSMGGGGNRVISSVPVWG